eukprot:gnl/Carplike_NY0171/4639_a6301_325.p1 GENE.gnl/Carplike_NY0171/4639_a6301_325~~gnl/Carplike_NY0171/4639_a6301_325.p1  ORF type:complete len:278 (-),score=79.08 gnl/Carplike_NY0171/4639_a6301_325:92-808(-)
MFVDDLSDTSSMLSVSDDDEKHTHMERGREREEFEEDSIDHDRVTKRELRDIKRLDREQKRAYWKARWDRKNRARKRSIYHEEGKRYKDKREQHYEHEYYDPYHNTPGVKCNGGPVEDSDDPKQHSSACPGLISHPFGRSEMVTPCGKCNGKGKCCGGLWMAFTLVDGGVEMVEDFLYELMKRFRTSGISEEKMDVVAKSLIKVIDKLKQKDDHGKQEEDREDREDQDDPHIAHDVEE